MTLNDLLKYALFGAFGAAAANFGTFEDYEDVKDFAHTWRELTYVELEDLDLRKRAEL